MGEVRCLERNVFPSVFGNIELTPAWSPSQSEMVGGLCQHLSGGAGRRRTLHGLSYLYPPQGVGNSLSSPSGWKWC